MHIKTRGLDLDTFWSPARPSQTLTSLLFFFFQNGAKSRFKMCFGPCTLGALANTRLHTPKAVTYHEQPHYCRFMIGHSLVRMESRIKKFTPHSVCRHGFLRNASGKLLHWLHVGTLAGHRPSSSRPKHRLNSAPWRGARLGTGSPQGGSRTTVSRQVDRGLLSLLPIPAAHPCL